MWLAVLLIAAMLLLDMRILSGIDSPFAAALSTALKIVGALLLMLLQYIFPVLARFEGSIGRNLKNASLLALSHLPKTLLMAAAVVGSVFITLYSTRILAFAIPVWLMLGFALLAYGNAALLVKIFDPFMPGTAQEEEECEE